MVAYIFPEFWGHVNIVGRGGLRVNGGSSWEQWLIEEQAQAQERHMARLPRWLPSLFSDSTTTTVQTRCRPSQHSSSSLYHCHASPRAVFTGVFTISTRMAVARLWLVGCLDVDKM